MFRSILSFLSLIFFIIITTSGESLSNITSLQTNTVSYCGNCEVGGPEIDGVSLAVSSISTEYTEDGAMENRATLRNLDHGVVSKFAPTQVDRILTGSPSTPLSYDVAIVNVSSLRYATVPTIGRTTTCVHTSTSPSESISLVRLYTGDPSAQAVITTSLLKMVHSSSLPSNCSIRSSKQPYYQNTTSKPIFPSQGSRAGTHYSQSSLTSPPQVVASTSNGTRGPQTTGNPSPVSNQAVNGSDTAIISALYFQSSITSPLLMITLATTEAQGPPSTSEPSLTSKQAISPSETSSNTPRGTIGFQTPAILSSPATLSSTNEAPKSQPTGDHSPISKQVVSISTKSDTDSIPAQATIPPTTTSFVLATNEPQQTQQTSNTPAKSPTVSEQIGGETTGSSDGSRSTSTGFETRSGGGQVATGAANSNKLGNQYHALLVLSVLGWIVYS